MWPRVKRKSNLMIGVRYKVLLPEFRPGADKFGLGVCVIRFGGCELQAG